MLIKYFMYFISGTIIITINTAHTHTHTHWVCLTSQLIELLLFTFFKTSNYSCRYFV